MRKYMVLKAITPVLGGLLVGTTGCSDSASDLGCSGELQASVKQLEASVTAMTALAAEFRLSVGTACKNIAAAGGMAPTLSAAPTDDEVKAACTAAEAAITAKLMAAGTVTLSVKGGECKVDAQAQVSCEGSCKVDAMCTEPELSARCEPGKFSVSCMGTCSGTATCEGSASVKAACQGTCNATCEGTCSGKCVGTCSGTCSAQNADGTCNGMCSGTCTGNCEATCNGTCTGKCQLEANASVTCMAEARCEGSCMGMATAPRCEAQLKPPMCKADAECQANCEGNAELSAKCTPPSVVFTASGTVDAAFVTALEANLPVLIGVFKRGDIVVQAAADIVTSFQGIVSASETCAVSLAGEIKAALDASISVKASVQVSGSASAKAGG